MATGMPRLVATSALAVLLAALAPMARAQGCPPGQVMNEGRCVAVTQFCAPGQVMSEGSHCTPRTRMGPAACPDPPPSGCGAFFGTGDVGFVDLLTCGFGGLGSPISPCLCNSLAGMRVTSDGKSCIPEKPDCDTNHTVGALSGVNPHCRTWPIKPQQAVDPNAKMGTLGVGDAGFVPASAPLNYAVHFENLATATAAAQVVVVTDQLDAQTMDLDTLQLGPISFADFTLPPQSGAQNFNGGIDLRPDQDLQVAVTAALDKSTGLLTWRFVSIDPATGQRTDEDAGFLPPNVNPPAGEGIVVFSVMPKRGLATGTPIHNQAQVVFDTNAPIATPTWLNTIDRDPPMTRALPLAASQTSQTFTVQWMGSDAGSGVSSYALYVSDNGGAFIPWIASTAATSASYTGQVGHAYGFFSIGTDLVGNVEALKTVADATTQVGSGPACASDLSSKVQITRSGFGYNFATQRFVQTVTLKNTSANAIVGPLSLVLDALSANATLANASGTTACAAPSGSPFVTLAGDLAAGAGTSVVLQFANPSKTGITYTTRVLAGSAPR